MSNWRLIKGWKTPVEETKPQPLREESGRWYLTDDQNCMNFTEKFMRDNPECFAKDPPGGWMLAENAPQNEWGWACILDLKTAEWIVTLMRRVGKFWYFADQSTSSTFNPYYWKPIEKPEAPKI